MMVSMGKSDPGRSDSTDKLGTFGGVWGMYKTNREGATGMFHGSRP